MIETAYTDTVDTGGEVLLVVEVIVIGKAVSEVGDALVEVVGMSLVGEGALLDETSVDEALEEGSVNETVETSLEITYI